jgi:hypothetical protein
VVSVHALQAPPLKQKSLAPVIGLTHAIGVGLAQAEVVATEFVSPFATSAGVSPELSPSVVPSLPIVACASPAFPLSPVASVPITDPASPAFPLSLVASVPIAVHTSPEF